jgi:cyclic pyranopterin phosphate synthase
MADYLRMARVFVSLGITKIRITGGEPLLRNGVVEFVRELSKLRTTTTGSPSESATAGMGHPDATVGVGHPSDDPDGGKLDLAITTNGHLLAEMAQPLADAGLRRVTISVDAMEPEKFSRITRVPGSYEAVMAGVRAAKRAGLSPIKVNCVLLRGFNDDQIVAFGKFARAEGVVVRFIEFMPLEEDRVWSPEIVVTLKEILAKLNRFMPLIEIEREPSETARRFMFEDGVGEIGIIAPVSEPFCGHCSRVRLTSDGKIRTCLFSVVEHDLYGLMRAGASEDELREFLVGVVNQKEERHHIGEPDFMPASRTMVHIGG